LLAEQHPLAGWRNYVVFGFVAAFVLAIGDQSMLKQLGHAFSAADHAGNVIHFAGCKCTLIEPVRAFQ